MRIWSLVKNLDTSAPDRDIHRLGALVRYSVEADELHMVDRACIGRCFAYANYEPPSKQFRVRPSHGSPIVTDSEDDSSNMENGDYVVRLEDLPINQIYQCDDRNLAKLCMRELSAGEENGRIGYRPHQF